VRFTRDERRSPIVSRFAAVPGSQLPIRQFFQDSEIAAVSRGTLTNNGTLDVAGDSSIFASGFNCHLTNDKGGTITTSAGNGTATLGGYPVNKAGGTINDKTGTLTWENDPGESGPGKTATSNGAVTVAKGATLSLRAVAPIVLGPKSTVTGGGTLQTINGGIDTIDGSPAWQCFRPRAAP
jgi:hypothetical protein